MATERGSLGIGQRLLLLSAWLVSCGFVYVLGVYVGKGMRGSGRVPRVVLPVDVDAPPSPVADVQSPLTFYDVLGARERGAVTPSAPRTPPSTAPTPYPTPGAGRHGADDRAAARRAAGGERDAAAPAVPSPPSPARPASHRHRRRRPHVRRPPSCRRPCSRPLGLQRPRASPPAPPPARWRHRPTATCRARAAPCVRAAPAVVRSIAARCGLGPGSPSPATTASGRWTVYANPSRDLLAVEHERAALRAKGYPAEVVTIRRDGDVWYRIRVGRYATQTQAEEAARRLRGDGAGHAFVQSE